MTITRVHTLSLAERDRRWAAIRSAMAERGLGALIIRCISSKWDSGTANVRYVSQIGGNGEEAIVVFPMTAIGRRSAGSQCSIVFSTATTWS